VMETAKPATAAETQHGWWAVLTQVPVRFVAAIAVLIVIAVIGFALGMSVHGVHHQMNMASPGIAWANG
jgi:hypothetical protein